MTQQKSCKSHIQGELTCKDGFVQRYSCWNQEMTKDIPFCLRDELPIHFINEDGTPRFFKETGRNK